MFWHLWHICHTLFIVVDYFHQLIETSDFSLPCRPISWVWSWIILSLSQSVEPCVYGLSLACLSSQKDSHWSQRGPDLLVDSGRLEAVATAAAPSPGAEQWRDSQTVVPLARTGATDCPLRRAGARSANLCQPQDNGTSLMRHREKQSRAGQGSPWLLLSLSPLLRHQASLAERPCAVLNTCTRRNWDICYGRAADERRGARATPTHGSQLDDYALRAFVINRGTPC